MPHESYADPVMNDGPRFHSDMPISELTKHETRAIKASVISSAPLIVKTEDELMHEIWPTPTDPNEAQGSSRPTLTRESN